MKTLSTLLLILLSFSLFSSPETEPEEKNKSEKKHVEHDLDFAHHLPMGSFYDVGGDPMLAFTLIVQKDDTVLFEQLDYGKYKKRLAIDVFIYKKAEDCSLSSNAVPIQQWLDQYSPGSKVKSIDLDKTDLVMYSFVSPFKEKDGNDRPGSRNRRGIQLKTKSCVVEFHDGSTIAHPKG